MRRLRNIICLIFVLSSLCFGGYLITVKLTEDRKPPVIYSEKEEIVVSVNDGETVLMQGLHATDDTDGDLTDSIRILSVYYLR